MVSVRKKVNNMVSQVIFYANSKWHKKVNANKKHIIFFDCEAPFVHTVLSGYSSSSDLR